MFIQKTAVRNREIFSSYQRGESIEGLAKRMREQYGVEAVAPAHCTGHLAFSVFRKVFGDQYRFFGLGETLSL